MIKGFKMKLYPGMEAEYEKRHNQLWPEMKDMIHEHGGKNYTISVSYTHLDVYKRQALYRGTTAGNGC